jgi:hypothetical protein
MQASSEALRAQQRVNQIAEQKESSNTGDDIVHWGASCQIYSRSQALVKYQQATKNRIATRM